MSNELMSIEASMNAFREQPMPGKLVLYSDKICFKANGVLEGTQVKDTFLFDDIQNVKLGISLMPHRITIQERDGEVWLFEQINKQQGKAFVDAYNEAREH